MPFQVMAPVVSTGNHSFAVEHYSKYKKPYHCQLQVLHVFLSLQTKQEAELPTHSFLSKVPALKMLELMLFFPSIVSGNVCWIYQLDFLVSAQEVRHGCTLGQSFKTCLLYYLIVCMWFFFGF